MILFYANVKHTHITVIESFIFILESYGDEKTSHILLAENLL